ncbi:MAG TPA: AMP-binding protein [Planctomycetota bacterium]|nr:AMP-binding protein [Planctomycetota bacterium]
MTTLDASTGDAHAWVAHGHVTDIEWRSGPALPSDAPRTVMELVAGCLRRFPDATVVRDAGRSATWRELDVWSGRLAATWAGHLAVGDRCAILVANGLPHLIVELACWRLGAVAAPIFLGFGAERVAGLLARLEPRVAVVDDPQIACVIPAGVQCTSTADVWRVVAQPAMGLTDRAVLASDPCLIQFTSGSTGVPRGVVLTHGNLASQQAAFALQWPEIGPGDRLAAYLPWHHSFGGLAERLWSLCRGADLTVVPGGGRDRRQLLDTIRAVAPTVFLSVPKIHALAVEERLFVRGGIRWVFTAGAPMPEDLRRWYAREAIPVCEGWGLTETSPSCTLTRPGEGRSGVVGEPIAGVSVGVRRSDGRILVRGPNVMAGYFRQETTTLRDGVLDTGDLGSWSEDGLCLRGRADHQLKLGNGEKVCAAAMEAALHANPSIHHAVVAAEPDLLAVVEVTDGHPTSDVLAAIDALNVRQSVPYQRISAVYGVARRMSVENGQLTPSLKVARGQVLESFRRWRCDGGADFIRYR